MSAKVPRSALLAFIGVFALVAAGCGGGGSGDDTASESSSGNDGGSELSEEEFIDEFDGICEDFSDDLDELQAQFAELEGDDYDGAAELVEEGGGILADGVDDLRAIDAPEELSDEVDDLFDLLDDRVDLIPDFVAALDDEDDEAIRAASDEGDDLRDDIRAISDEIGLECYAGANDRSDDVSDSSDDLSDDFSDSSDDFSDDFSDELPELGEPRPPSEVIPEYGTADRDARFDGLADSCFSGDLADCDRLYQLTPATESIFSYEGYGATCGGRLNQEAEAPGTCETRG